MVLGKAALLPSVLSLFLPTAPAAAVPMPAQLTLTNPSSSPMTYPVRLLQLKGIAWCDACPYTGHIQAQLRTKHMSQMCAIGAGEGVHVFVFHWHCGSCLGAFCFFRDYMRY